jgi:hypothetical protein
MNSRGHFNFYVKVKENTCCRIRKPLGSLNVAPNALKIIDKPITVPLQFNAGRTANVPERGCIRGITNDSDVNSCLLAYDGIVRLQLLMKAKGPLNWIHRSLECARCNHQEIRSPNISEDARRSEARNNRSGAIVFRSVLST